MESTLIIVRLAYDDSARVWYIQTSDLPGLAGEAPTVENLIERIPGMIADLIEENGFAGADVAEIPVEIIASRHARVRLRDVAGMITGKQYGIPFATLAALSRGKAAETMKFGVARSAIAVSLSIRSSSRATRPTPF